MSTNVGSIHYDLNLNTDGFDKASAGLNNKIGGITSKMKDVGDSMANAGKKMTIGLTLPIAIGTGIAIKAASDLGETMNKVSVAFGQSSVKVVEFGNNSLKSIGVAKGTALDAAALFGDMATSMGLNTDEAANMSINMVKLGGDLASFKNISFERSQIALAGVFTGETEALKSLGIVMTETNLAAFAQSKGITKNIQSMTQSEKVNLRYAFVMNATKNAQGDFTRTIDSTANQMRMTSERVKELSAQFGEKLLPVTGQLLILGNKLLDWFTALSPAAQNSIFAFVGFLAVLGPLLIIFGKLASAVSAISVLWPAISAAIAATPIGWVTLAVVALIAVIALLAANWDKVKDAFNRFWTAIQPIRDFIGEQLTSAFESLKSIWAQLVVEMQPLIDMFKEFWSQHGTQVIKILEILGIVLGAIVLAPLIIGFAILAGALKVLAVILKFVSDNFTIIKDIVMAVLAVAFGPIIAIVNVLIFTFNMLKNGIMALVNFFVQAFTAIWAFIQPILTFILNLYIIVFGTIFLVILNAVNGIRNVITTVFTAISGFIGAVMQGVLNIITTIWNAIWGFIGPTVMAIYNTIAGVFGAVYNFLAGIFNGILNVARNIWNAIYNTIAGAVNNVRNFFGNAGSWLVDAGSNIIRGLINGINNMAGAIFNKAQEIANGVKDRIKGALGIRSPSTVMMGLGLNVGKGLEIGMQKALPRIQDMALNMANSVKTPVANISTAGNNGGNETSINNNIYGNITLGDVSAVDRFFDNLNRNGELARKGMTTI